MSFDNPPEIKPEDKFEHFFEKLTKMSQSRIKALLGIELMQNSALDKFERRELIIRALAIMQIESNLALLERLMHEGDVTNPRQFTSVALIYRDALQQMYDRDFTVFSNQLCLLLPKETKK